MFTNAFVVQRFRMISIMQGHGASRFVSVVMMGNGKPWSKRSFEADNVVGFWFLFRRRSFVDAPFKGGRSGFEANGLDKLPTIVGRTPNSK